MARPVASLATTFGIAAGTLIIGGTILAGPSLVDCSGAPGGLAACLGDRMSGLVPIRDDTDASGPSVTQPADAGWIDANAGEYEPPLSRSVELTPAPPPLAISGPAPSIAPAPTLVAELSPPSLEVSAAGALPRAPGVEVTDLDASAPADGTMAVAVAAPPPSVPMPVELTTPGSLPALAVSRSWAPPPEIVAALAPAPTVGTMAIISPEPAPIPLPAPLGPASRAGVIAAPAPIPPAATDVALVTPPISAAVFGLPSPVPTSDSLVLVPSPGTLAAGVAKTPATYASIADLAPDTLIAPLAVLPAPPGPGGAVVNLEAGVGSDTLVTGGIGMSIASVATVTLEASAPPNPLPDPLPPAATQQYPDVILLVPPAKGGNSSFVTLKLN